jgi:hypothetical protein
MLLIRPFKAYDPQKGGPYPEVVYEDVMSKDAAVLEWLEKIVSLPWRITTFEFRSKIGGLPLYSGYGDFAS